MVVTFDEVHEWMAQANLVILLGVVALVGLSLFLERKKKWVWHGNSMIVVMLVTALLVIVHMVPSFVKAAAEALSGFDIVAISGVIHGVIGAVAFFSGAWLVWVWAIGESSDTKFCAPRKKFMWKILALWFLSLGLGVLYYLLHISFG
jgi:hypothetical protein